MRTRPCKRYLTKTNDCLTKHDKFRWAHDWLLLNLFDFLDQHWDCLVGDIIWNKCHGLSRHVSAYIKRHCRSQGDGCLYVFFRNKMQHDGQMGQIVCFQKNQCCYWSVSHWLLLCPVASIFWSMFLLLVFAFSWSFLTNEDNIPNYILLHRLPCAENIW